MFNKLLAHLESCRRYNTAMQEGACTHGGAPLTMHDLEGLLKCYQELVRAKAIQDTQLDICQKSVSLLGLQATDLRCRQAHLQAAVASTFEFIDLLVRIRGHAMSEPERDAINQMLVKLNDATPKCQGAVPV